MGVCKANRFVSIENGSPRGSGFGRIGDSIPDRDPARSGEAVPLYAAVELFQAPAGPAGGRA
jgi:hypothetical protein